MEMLCCACVIKERAKQNIFSETGYVKEYIRATSSTALQTIFTFSMCPWFKEFPLRTGNISARSFELCVGLLLLSHWAIWRQSILISWMHKPCKWDASTFGENTLCPSGVQENRGWFRIYQNKTRRWSNPLRSCSSHTFPHMINRSVLTPIQKVPPASY